MAVSLRAVTINLADINDYNVSCDVRTKEVGKAENLRQYTIAEEATSALLLKTQASVFFLQEVTKNFETNQERNLIQKLRERNYAIIRVSSQDGTKEKSKSDAVIALHKGSFEDIQDESTKFGDIDVAIATAVDKESKKKMLFISAHFTGFSLTGDLSSVREGAVFGDNDATSIMKTIKEKYSDCEIQIVGADMNSNLNIGEAQKNSADAKEASAIGAKRFHIFKGFTVHGSGQATSINKRDSRYQERELDFILVKKISSFFKSFFSIFTKTKIETEIKVVEGARIGSVDYASDHLPVMLDLTITEEKTVLGRFLSRITSCFHSEYQAVSQSE